MKLAQNRPLQEAQLQTQIESINLKVQRSKRLPLIFGDANIQRNLIIPVTPVPAIAFNPSAQAGAIMPLRFATDWSAKAGLQLSLDIFNPQSRANVGIATMQYDKSKLNEQVSKINFENHIIDLYAQTYLSQKQLDIALENEEHYKTTLAVLESRYNAGRLSVIEWNKTQQKFLELIQNREEAQYVLENKYIALSQYIDISSFDNLTTAIDQLLPNDKDDLELKQMALDANWKKQQLGLIKSEILPKITLNGYIGAQHFSNEFKIFDGNLWYGNSFVNLTLRVPITEWYENKLKQQQVRKEYDLAQFKLEDKQRNLSVLKWQKNTNITVLEHKIETLQQTIKLIQDNISILKIKVNEGKILVTELNTELELLLKTFQQLWQTQYELLQTKIKD